MRTHGDEAMMPGWARMLIFSFLACCVCHKPDPLRSSPSCTTQQSVNSIQPNSTMAGDDGNSVRELQNTKCSNVISHENESVLKQILTVLEMSIRGQKQSRVLDSNEWQQGADIIEVFCLRVILCLFFMIPLVCLGIAPNVDNILYAGE